MSDDYLVEHLHDALATDQRTGELEVTVELLGDRVVLGGVVGNDARRAAVLAVVAERCGEVEVLDQMEVVVTTGPPTAEQL